MADIEPVDHGAGSLGDLHRRSPPRQLLQRMREIGMHAPRVNAQQAARIFRLLRVDVESQPGGNGLRRKLRGGEIDGNDRRDARGGRGRGLQGR